MSNEAANNDSDQNNNNNNQAMHDIVEIMNETANEAAPIRLNMDELADIMVNVENQVDEIMNELRQDEDLRNILEQPETFPEDEGIEINPLEDLEDDIEPFDFDLEVQNYMW